MDDAEWEALPAEERQKRIKQQKFQRKLIKDAAEISSGILSFDAGALDGLWSDFSPTLPTSVKEELEPRDLTKPNDEDTGVKRVMNDDH